MVFQVVSQPDAHPEAAADCGRLRSEFVVRVSGKVRRRKDPNPRIPSGNLELAVTSVDLLNVLSKQIPFLPSEDEKLSEETRLRHRILDLRCFKIIQAVGCKLSRSPGVHDSFAKMLGAMQTHVSLRAQSII